MIPHIPSTNSQQISAERVHGNQGAGGTGVRSRAGALRLHGKTEGDWRLFFFGKQTAAELGKHIT